MADPVRYHVDLDRRHQHLVTVRLTVPADLAPGARVVLPVWTPGSYVVRNHVHHVQRVDAPVPVEFDGTSAWRLPADVDGPVELSFELYANELSVRTNHVDDHHALLVGPATFAYVEGAVDRRHEVRVAAPGGWRVFSLLARDGDVFVADRYDTLADGVFEAGDHPEVAYTVAGVPHRFVFAGHGRRPDLDRIAADAARLGEAAVTLFDGDLPVDAYTFLCESWTGAAGGLEHRDGAVLAADVHGLAEPDSYRSFQSLLAHEYLHLWNVKRLTPVALTHLDYERPVVTPSLWVAEGWTAYYDELLPLRAGLWEPRRFLDRAGDLVRRVLDRPGRRLQSVRQASYEAWTKFYVRDENWPNVGVSYYEHGAVLAWCLDLIVRRHRPDSDGLDDALRLLWRRFGRTGTGYTEDDVEQAVGEVAGTDLSGFFADHVAGTDDPPIGDLLEVVGLCRRDEAGDQPRAPDLGVEVAEDDEGVTFRSVLRGGPAWQAGLTGGDRLLAIGGMRVRRGELRPALLGHAPGDTVEVAVFRGPRLVTAAVTLGAPRPGWKLETVHEPSDAQRAAFERWTARPWPAPAPSAPR